MSDASVLDTQIRYYRARAPEYDEWLFRRGRYDHGREHRHRWFSELSTVEAALHEARPGGDVLELACGTGLWTRHLAPRCERLTAVDAAPEALDLNRKRVCCDRVEYVEADLFSWEPARRYDFAFFGFWLSHVPPERFELFWDLVRKALKVTGRAFFVDSRQVRESTATAQPPPPDPDVLVPRELNDGRRFQIIKIFYEPQALHRRLTTQGWHGYVRSTERFFIYGCVSPPGTISSAR